MLVASGGVKIKNGEAEEPKSGAGSDANLEDSQIIHFPYMSERSLRLPRRPEFEILHANTHANTSDMEKEARTTYM